MKVKAVPYGSPEYWESRYKKEADEQGQGFEWYPTADELVCAEAAKRVAPGSKLLEIGSGSSQLAFKLHEACGRGRGTSFLFTDISETVVATMSAKWRADGGDAQAKSDMEFAVMDCCDLPVASDSVDFVVDKGTLDAIDCTDERNTSLCLREVHRVLRRSAPGAGLYLLVSCRDPEGRRQDFGDLFTVLEILEVRADPKASSPCPDAYFYILEKKNAS